MENRKENLKKINEKLHAELEMLSDEQLEDIAGGCRYPGGAAQRGIDAYKAIKNLIELINGGDKVY